MALTSLVQQVLATGQITETESVQLFSYMYLPQLLLFFCIVLNFAHQKKPAGFLFSVIY